MTVQGGGVHQQWDRTGDRRPVLFICWIKPGIDECVLVLELWLTADRTLA